MRTVQAPPPVAAAPAGTRGVKQQPLMRKRPLTLLITSPHNTAYKRTHGTQVARRVCSQPSAHERKGVRVVHERRGFHLLIVLTVRGLGCHGGCYNLHSDNDNDTHTHAHTYSKKRALVTRGRG